MKLFLLAFALIPLAYADQRVVVKGQLMCNDKPFKGALVKLYDKDAITLDDLMAKKETGADGTFDLDGKRGEVTNIDPYLYIFHDCDDGWKPCQRKWRFGIPSQYLNDPKKASPKVMDFGIMNLNVRQEEESRDCIHK